MIVQKDNNVIEQKQEENVKLSSLLVILCW